MHKITHFDLYSLRTAQIIGVVFPRYASIMHHIVASYRLKPGVENRPVITYEYLSQVDQIA